MHFTPAKIQDFLANKSGERYPRGCSPVGRVPDSWHLGDVNLFADSGLLRARDSELLHSKLERGAFYPESRGRPIGTGEDPVSLFQN
jgi:hypothetical protein